MLRVIEFLDDLTLPKTLTIASNDDDARYVKMQFESMDHTIDIVPSDCIEDDRPNYLQTFRYFQNGGVRNLCITYAVWKSMFTEVERYLMDHDVLILYDLDEYVQNDCMDMALDARRRGFHNKHRGYHIVIAQADENFLIHKVE